MVEVVSIEVHAGLEASGEAAVGSTVILYENSIVPRRW